jgi:hypothetical protein
MIGDGYPANGLKQTVRQQCQVNASSEKRVIGVAQVGDQDAARWENGILSQLHASLATNRFAPMISEIA